MIFSFRPLQESDIPLLYQWTSLPPIAEWWQEPTDYEVFYQKYAGRLAASGIYPHIIFHGTTPLGYIVFYSVHLFPFESLSFPANTYGIDFFIADPDYRGKGYAAPIVKKFIQDIIMPREPKKIIVDPNVSNTKAIKVFEKAGFLKTVIYNHQQPKNPPLQIMEMNLCKPSKD